MNFAKDNTIRIEMVEMEVFFEVGTEEDCDRCVQKLETATSYGKVNLTYANTVRSGYVVSLKIPINRELDANCPIVTIDAGAILLSALQEDDTVPVEPSIRVTLCVHPDTNEELNIVHDTDMIVYNFSRLVQYIGCRAKLRKVVERTMTQVDGDVFLDPLNPNHNPE